MSLGLHSYHVSYFINWMLDLWIKKKESWCFLLAKVFIFSYQAGSVATKKLYHFKNGLKLYWSNLFLCLVLAMVLIPMAKSFSGCRRNPHGFELKLASPPLWVTAETAALVFNLLPNVFMGSSMKPSTGLRELFDDLRVCVGRFWELFLCGSLCSTTLSLISCCLVAWSVVSDSSHSSVH